MKLRPGEEIQPEAFGNRKLLSIHSLPVSHTEAPVESTSLSVPADQPAPAPGSSNMRAAQTTLLAIVLLGALFASVAARPGEQPALPSSVRGRTELAGIVRLAKC